MSNEAIIVKLTDTIRRDYFSGLLVPVAHVLLVGGILLLAPSAQGAVNTFQEGVAGYSGTQDTYLDEQFPDTPEGSANSVLVEYKPGPNQTQQGLIRFDNIFGSGPGQIPFGSIINSASLTVNVGNNSKAAAQIRLHRMLVSWPETATWNSMTGGIQTDDIEAMSAFDAQVTDPASTGPETITGLAAALQAWSDGASNYGWAIISDHDDGWDFDSSENSTTGNRPLLTVDWSPGICPGGVVTTTVDSATGGSLRACIIWANGNPGADTLAVPAGTYTLTIAGTGEDAAATGDLDITDDIVINGDAVSATIIDANGIDRVFDVLGASATFSNLTIRNGNVTGNGGGIAVDGAGSAILSASTLTGNTATDDGGGISTAGGAVALTNVTLSGNTGDRRGGGLNCEGPCTLTNVTITANSGIGDGGGGVRVRVGVGSVTVRNTIIANNLNDDCDGAAISLGNNLDSDGSCALAGPGDLSNTNPMLGPLQDNGGPTFTHELLAGSPAIEGGTNTGCPATDQRGIARPVNLNCDIGAYEAEFAPLNLIKTAFWTDGTPIPTGANIPNGVEFKYLLYINNAGIARTDVSVRDVLDAAFQYQTGTIQVDNSVAECAVAVCTAAEEQTIFTAVDGAAFLSDVVDGDVGSYTGASTSIDAGNQTVANLQLDINADAVWAILFSVKML